MKLKAVFILFNVVLGVAFLVLFFSPAFLLGGQLFPAFWASNWIVAIVFLVALASVNAWFLANWGLFTRLEREDWAGLAEYLEGRIFRKGMIFSFYVRILLNTYLVTSHLEEIRALEAFLRGKKPSLIGKFSLQLGIPYLLMKDPVQSEAFFGSLLARKGARNASWLRWNRAFSLLQMGKAPEACTELASLQGDRSDPVLDLLTLYILEAASAGREKWAAVVASGRARLRAKFTAGQFARLSERARDNVEVLVLWKLVQDAQEWLFAAEPR